METLKFEFPDTGEGVTEGKFLEWLVDEGEEVEEDQSVAEVETDKAVVEIPAPSDGTIGDLKVEPGDTVEVGQVIMTIDTGESGGKEETVEESEEKTEEVEEELVEEPEEKKPEKETEPRASTATSGDVLALPKVRKLAREKGVELASIKTGERITEDEVLEAAEGSSDTGTETTETDSTTTASTPEGVNATPAVRKLAREKNIDIGNVEGSGRGGKVTREDIINAAEGGKTSKDRTTGSTTGEVERVEMTPARKTIADRMEESKFTAPHVTHIDTADVTRLAEMREEVKDRYDAHITYLPFMMKASLQALKDYPDLNAELDEENDEVLRKKFYDFNIAVDTERGLMVPVVKDVDRKNIVELAGDIAEKAEKAREGSLSREEMTGGTFSITNIGAIGGEGFTPIINYPQVAILGVGKIQETPQVVDGEVVPRTTVKLSLSYDHRVVDGATAARFLNEIKDQLENPEDMMVNL